MSGTKIVSHEFWSTQMVEMLPKMIDPPSHDACIIVGTTQIPVDKTVLRLNSSLLTDGIVHQNTSSGVTQIEVEPEFDDQPQLVGDIVNSFYSGTITIEEKDLKVMYKFGKSYKIGWLLKVVKPMLYKTAAESYERFKEIFTFAHFIYDTDLLESCITVLDENFLKSLTEDKDMLSKISYSWMELITKSATIGISEKGLFTLLASWAECREQKLSGLKDLFENIKYELLDMNFIVENVMEIMTKDIVLSSFYMGRLQQRLRIEIEQHSLAIGDKQLKRGDVVPVSHFITEVIDLVNNKKEVEVDVAYLNYSLRNLDFKCVSEDLIVKLIPTISSENIIVNLDILSVANVLSNYKCVDAAKLFIDKMNSMKLKPSDFYKIEWTRIKPDAILHLQQLCSKIKKNCSYIVIIEVTLTWCLRNSETVSTGIMTEVTNGVCYKTNPPFYKDNGFYASKVLLPTIKHLLPNTTELRCSHPGECYGKYRFAIINTNLNLYKLQSFEDENVKMSDKDGLLELKSAKWMDKLVLFNNNMPFYPNYPISFQTLDDAAIRDLVGSLGPGDKIAAFNTF